MGRGVRRDSEQATKKERTKDNAGSQASALLSFASLRPLSPLSRSVAVAIFLRLRRIPEFLKGPSNTYIGRVTSSNAKSLHRVTYKRRNRKGREGTATCFFHFFGAQGNLLFFLLCFPAAGSSSFYRIRKCQMVHGGFCKFFGRDF
jgi:hypothetical protein